MTKKAIKNLVARGIAEDITHLSFNECNALRDAHSFSTVEVSSGVYGMNAALLKDETGKLYAITERNSRLFQMV